MHVSLRSFVIILLHLSFLQGLAKNLEQPEIKDWLADTKDMLMSEKGGKEKDDEAKKLNLILTK